MHLVKRSQCHMGKQILQDIELQSYHLQLFLVSSSLIYCYLRFTSEKLARFWEDKCLSIRKTPKNFSSFFISSFD